MKKITKDISIEELVENYPFSVDYLAKNGIRCIVCGEPIWGTLEEASEEKGFDADAVAVFVKELNELNDNYVAKTDDNVKKIDTGKLDV
ncbi:MAG: DUF1858 domain-containing protein [Chlorobi bacterium]|nr:DUF1858 domain-containing protein [Chlorobiota bacterium]